MDVWKQLKWILIGLLFSLAVVGMFFAYTHNSTWPEQTLRLSASDMRLTHPMSTSICESVDLNSDHTFMAHHVADQAKVNPSTLTRNTMDFSLELKRFQQFQLRYFLLPESIITVVVCASSPGSSIYLVRDKGEVSRRSKRRVNSPFDLDYDDSTENHKKENEHHKDETRTMRILEKSNVYKNCPNILKSQEIPSTYIDDALMCQFTTETHPIQLNVTEADTYGILFGNTFSHNNHLNIRLIIDRTTYSIDKEISNFHVCPAGSVCTVPLSFCSKDRVLVWIPNEPQAGLTTYKIHVQCKPRFALFLTLIILIPVLIFSIAAVFMKIGVHLSSQYSSLHQSRRNGCSVACTNLFTKEEEEKHDNQHLTAKALLETGDIENHATIRGEMDTFTLVTYSGEDHEQYTANHELPSYEAVCEEHPPPYSCSETSMESKM